MRITSRRQKVLRFIGYCLLAVVAVFGALAALIAVVKPGPAGRIVIAAGGAGGLYEAQAERYKKELARYGVDLDIRPEIEGISTLEAVVQGLGGVQAGFLKGGMIGGLQGRYATMQEQYRHDVEAQALRSLGRLFHEPIYVFYTGTTQVKRLRDFKGRKIMIGGVNGGTRRVVAHLLKANGIDASNSTLVERELPEDAAPLKSGEVDVAFVILPPEASRVQKLLRVDGVLLMDFSAEADAYVTRFPYLSKVVMDQGAVEFAPDLPTADITLLATSTMLAVSKEMHPSLSALLTHVVMKVPKPSFDASGEPILFHPAGQFPRYQDPELQIDEDAVPIHRSGDLPFFLRSLGPFNKNWGLPFWVTAFLHQHGTQMILILIPLLSVAVPLARVLPSIYNWSQRRRLLQYYQQLKTIEFDLKKQPSARVMQDMHSDLDDIDRAVATIKVPLYLSDQLYDLRGHIDLVRQRLAERERLRVAA